MELLTIILANLHHVHAEYIVALLSALVLYLRFAPLAGNWRILLYAAQAGLFVAQMYSIWRKRHPNSGITPKLFVAEVAQHYLETHPKGKEIAKHSQIDEKVTLLLHDSQVPGNG